MVHETRQVGIRVGPLRLAQRLVPGHAFRHVGGCRRGAVGFARPIQRRRRRGYHPWVVRTIHRVASDHVHPRPSDPGVAPGRYRWNHVVRAPRRARHLLRPRPGGDQKITGGFDDWKRHAGGQRFAVVGAQVRAQPGADEVRVRRGGYSHGSGEVGTRGRPARRRRGRETRRPSRRLSRRTRRRAGNVRGSSGQCQSRVVAPG